MISIMAFMWAFASFKYTHLKVRFISSSSVDFKIREVKLPTIDFKID